MRRQEIAFALAVALGLGSGCNEPGAKPIAAQAAAPAAAAPAADASAATETDWIPAEHKKGDGKWKDCGVYVDGVPMGVVAYGELPVKLQPVWIQSEGYNDIPGFEPEVARRYRVAEYLEAIGVDLKQVKMLHVYGPKPMETIVVTGAELRRKRNDFLFKFGGDTYGKPIPIVPDDFGNNRSPDKMTAIMVFIDKKPTEIVRNQGHYLDGKLVDGVPYYGEPMRGGVRVYKDDRLVAFIKRKDLQSALAEKGPDGAPRWSLAKYLESKGVDTSGVVEGQIIFQERRREKLDQNELASATFTADAQAHGKVLLDGHPVNAIALHSTTLSPEMLAHFLPKPWEDAEF